MSKSNIQMNIEVDGQEFNVTSNVELVRQNADFIQGGTSYWTTNRDTLETTLHNVLQQAADTFAVLAFLDEEARLAASVESEIKTTIVTELEAKNALPKNDPAAIEAIVEYISTNFQPRPPVIPAPVEPVVEPEPVPAIDPETGEVIPETEDDETVEGAVEE